jgi:hypothetical protein
MIYALVCCLKQQLDKVTFFSSQLILLILLIPAIPACLCRVLASILPGGLVDEDELFKEGEEGEDEGEGGQRRRQVGFMGDVQLLECASLSTYTRCDYFLSSLFSSPSPSPSWGL